MDHYDVLIATPGAKMEAQYVRSLVATLAECDKRGITYKWLSGYSSLVHHARELTASGGQGLELNPDHKGPVGDSVTYNKIFWIDSDIEWAPKQFFQLYDAPEEVISGGYLLANGQTTTVHTQEFPQGIPKNVAKKMSRVIQVQGVGFGFVAVKSGVFERMERPWFAHVPQQVMTSSGKHIFDSLGEDVSWCIRAQRAGVPIHFDPGVLVNHIKTIPVNWE